MAERVTFSSDGLRLVGELRVPNTGGRRPALVFTGPLSGVKEQVVGRYAAALAERGFVTLAFDHRGFGDSEGEPRQHESAAGRLGDLRDAVSLLAAHQMVDSDRIGCVGICLGGGYALRFGAFDPRVRVVACVAGGFNDPRAMRAGMGAAGYRAQLARFLQIAEQQAATGEIQYWAAVEDGSDRPVVMGGDEPAAYYGTERSASPGWVNRLTALSVLELLTVDLAMGAEFISPTPLLVVHGRKDDYCSPEGAQAVFERAGEPKELVWIDTTNHIDYDQEPYVPQAVEQVTRWFTRHLG